MRKLSADQVQKMIIALNAPRRGTVALIELRDVHEALMSVVDEPVRGQALPLPDLSLSKDLDEVEDILDSTFVGFERNLEAAFHGMKSYSLAQPSDEAIDLAIRSWMQKVYVDTARRTEFDLAELMNGVTDEIFTHDAKRVREK